MPATAHQSQFHHHLEHTLKELHSSGLLKVEREMESPQSGIISVGQDVHAKDDIINLCANNYLGMANHPRLIQQAKAALDKYGYGMASVRFICGTHSIHRALEKRIADFLEKEDAILFAACFDANGGLFEPLLTDKDAIVSDSLNHASIIDGIRLCKAKRYRYANSDMQDLEAQLIQAREDGARFIMIATDGVFSMDGTMAKLPEITGLADKYQALVMVDDCHATGFIGPQGRGTAAHFGVNERIDVVSGTLGKALGGAIGGYIAANKCIVDILRQRSRPYLFSNSLPPSIVASSIEAINHIEKNDQLRKKLFDNTQFWRNGLAALGFNLLPGEHPIIPVMLGDATLAQQMANELFKLGVYVSGFFYPVVPLGQARIRTQMNASLNQADLERALLAFEEAGRRVGVLT